METVALKGLTRKETGKKATKALRREGQIPCALYGKEDVTHFSVTFKDIKPLVYTANFKLAEIEIDGENRKCIVKDKDFHPVSENIEHIEFIELLEGRKLKVDIPIRFEGVSPGVKEGGILIQNLRRLSIKTTPKYLIDELILDISNLSIGQSVRVRDINDLEGVEIMSPEGTPVATIIVPRVLRTEEEDAALLEEGEEGAEEGTEATQEAAEQKEG